jgi:hypothetical protein
MVTPLKVRAGALARLERARAEAELEYRKEVRELIKNRRGSDTDKEIESLLVQMVHARFFAFAEEALNGDSDTVTVRLALERYVHDVIDEVFMAEHPQRFTAFAPQARGRFHDFAAFCLKNSESWVDLQNALIERAEEDESLGPRDAAPAKAETVQVIENGGEERFPERANWLRRQLAARHWGLEHVIRHNGPDRKTLNKILAGKPVREDVLERLAAALSASKKAPQVSVADIPNN